MRCTDTLLWCGAFARCCSVGEWCGYVVVWSSECGRVEVAVVTRVVMRSVAVLSVVVVMVDMVGVGCYSST